MLPARVSLAWSAALFITVAACAARAQAPEMEETEQDAATGSTEDQLYRKLVREAVNEYRAGYFDEALTLFEQAYAIRPTARVLRGMAKAQFELKLYPAALVSIDAALAHSTDPLPETLATELRELRERVLRYVGTVMLRVQPAGAEVVLDGRPVDAREPVVLAVGRHQLEVQARGHRSVRRVLDVGGGARIEVAIALERLVTPPPVVVKERVAEPDRAPVYVSAAVALAGIGGIVGTSLWFVDRDAAVDACREASAAGARCSNADQIAMQRDASMWMIGASAAAVLGGGIAFAVLLATEPSPSDEALRCRPGEGCAFALRW